MVVAIDVDGVIRDFTGSLIRKYKEDFPNDAVLPIVSWWFAKSFPMGEGIYKYYAENGENIFGLAKPFEGARQFIERIELLGHEVIFVTTQPMCLEAITLEWLYRNIGVTHNLNVVFTKNKNLVRYDILLDDSPSNVESAREAGNNAVYFTQEWNKHLAGKRVSSYQEFLELLVDAQISIEAQYVGIV